MIESLNGTLETQDQLVVAALMGRDFGKELVLEPRSARPHSVSRPSLSAWRRVAAQVWVES